MNNIFEKSKFIDKLVWSFETKCKLIYTYGEFILNVRKFCTKLLLLIILLYYSINHKKTKILAFCVYSFVAIGIMNFQWNWTQFIHCHKGFSFFISNLLMRYQPPILKKYFFYFYISFGWLFRLAAATHQIVVVKISYSVQKKKLLYEFLSIVFCPNTR